LILESPPANDVIIAVIVNTDYIYKGEATRKAHFDYRIQIDTALTVPAHTHKRWYAWNNNPSNDNPPALTPITPPDTFAPSDIILALNHPSPHVRDAARDTKIDLSITDKPEAVVQPVSEEELKNLMLMPNFSTRSEVTQTSGRGVGGGAREPAGTALLRAPHGDHV